MIALAFKVRIGNIFIAAGEQVRNDCFQKPTIVPVLYIIDYAFGKVKMRSFHCIVKHDIKQGAKLLQFLLFIIRLQRVSEDRYCRDVHTILHA